MTQFDAGDVRRYYDRHTPAFIRFGQGGSAGAIHRAVWGAGVQSRQQAFHYVDERIADLACALPPDSRPPHLVDLGCGVGGSLCYLARKLPIRGTGVTLSPLQVQLAARRISEAGLAGRVTCVEADFCRIPATVEPADLAYAIESFVHGPSAKVMLDAWADLVRPGGVLVICDDFRRPSTDAWDALSKVEGRPAAGAQDALSHVEGRAGGGDAAARAIDRFRRGWHINTLIARDELQAYADAAGFDLESTIDLTPALETARPRDRLLARLTTVAGWLAPRAPRIDYMLGGTALQECLAQGWIGYDFTVFRRRR
jgi:SAM-dependent methyltransferase